MKNMYSIGDRVSYITEMSDGYKLITAIITDVYADFLGGGPALKIDGHDHNGRRVYGYVNPNELTLTPA